MTEGVLCTRHASKLCLFAYLRYLHKTLGLFGRAPLLTYSSALCGFYQMVKNVIGFRWTDDKTRQHLHLTTSLELKNPRSPSLLVQSSPESLFHMLPPYSLLESKKLGVKFKK